MENPLSDSHLGPHTKPQGPCNKADSREAVCFLVHSLQRQRLHFYQPQNQPEIAMKTNS